MNFKLEMILNYQRETEHALILLMKPFINLRATAFWSSLELLSIFKVQLIIMKNWLGQVLVEIQLKKIMTYSRFSCQTRMQWTLKIQWISNNLQSIIISRDPTNWTWILINISRPHQNKSIMKNHWWVNLHLNLIWTYLPTILLRCRMYLNLVNCSLLKKN